MENIIEGWQIGNHYKTKMSNKYSKKAKERSYRLGLKAKRKAERTRQQNQNQTSSVKRRKIELEANGKIPDYNPAYKINKKE